MIESVDHAAEWLRVGIVGKAHGLRGSFFVSGRDELIPAACKTLQVGSTPATGKILTITESRWQAGRPLVTCREIASREDAEAIAGESLWMPRAQLVVDARTEYLWIDLPHRQVMTLAGSLFGTIRSVYNVGASDVVEIVSSDGRIFDVPLITAYFDLQSVAGGGPLRLSVDATVLEDLCQETSR